MEPTRWPRLVTVLLGGAVVLAAVGLATWAAMPPKPRAGSSPGAPRGFDPLALEQTRAAAEDARSVIDPDVADAPPEEPEPAPAGPAPRLADFPVEAPAPFGNEMLPSGYSWKRLVRELGTGAPAEVAAVADALARQHLADARAAAERAQRRVDPTALEAAKAEWTANYLGALGPWVAKLRADAARAAREATGLRGSSK